MEFGTKYDCKSCGKESSSYYGKGMLYLGIENLDSEYSPISKAVPKKEKH
ncbi:hypothetical protein OAA91_00735 [Fibrobacterales bacterium]|nr:hypothetical protein [Fibrobacterales bacterium]